MTIAFIIDKHVLALKEVNVFFGVRCYVNGSRYRQSRGRAAVKQAVGSSKLDALITQTVPAACWPQVQN